MHTHSFSLSFLFMLISQLTLAQVSKVLWKDSTGKYIYQVTGRINALDLMQDDLSQQLWIKADHIPIGTKVTLTSPVSKKPLQVKVVDSLGDPEQVLQGSPYLISTFLRQTDADERVTLTYRTPLDSLLAQAAKLPAPKAIEAYQKLAYQFKHYSLPNLEKAPPVIRLQNLLPQLSQQEQFNLYDFFIEFFGERKEVAPYLKKYIELYKQQGNQDKEAEYWLRLGDAINASVDYKAITQDNNRPTELQNPEKLAQRVAKKTNYSLKDIVRWNRFGGYFSSYHLYYFEEKFRLYPNPAQFSDKEYLEYLKIRQTQGQADKIAWGLKKLGDLHRLKTGYNKAETYYLKLIKLREKGNDKDKLAWIWGYLAKFYWEQKKYDQAEVYFKKIYALRTQTKDYRRMIWTLGGLRYLRYTQGKLDEALAYQKKILELYEQLDYGNRSFNLYFVITDYIWVYPNKKQMIIAYLIKWTEEYKNNPELAKKYGKEYLIITEYLARFSGEAGKFEQAAQYQQYSIPYIKDSLEQWRKINDVAFFYQRAKRYRKSLKFYRQGLAKTQLMSNKVYEALQYYKIGYYYHARGKTKQAFKQFEKSWKVFQQLPADIPYYFYEPIEVSKVAKFLYEEIKYRDIAIPLFKEFIRITAGFVSKTKYQNLLESMQKK